MPLLSASYLDRLLALFARASNVSYDNTESGLDATDVQAAIDEVAGGGGGGPSPSDATPQQVAVSNGFAGGSNEYSRGDHVHPYAPPVAALFVGKFIMGAGDPLPGTDVALLFDEPVGPSGVALDDYIAHDTVSGSTVWEVTRSGWYLFQALLNITGTGTNEDIRMRFYLTASPASATPTSAIGESGTVSNSSGRVYPRSAILTPILLTEGDSFVVCVYPAAGSNNNGEDSDSTQVAFWFLENP